MDTTMECALRIISKLSSGNWRRCYWVNLVDDEIKGFRVAGLNKQADLLEQQLTEAISKKEISELSPLTN